MPFAARRFRFRLPVRPVCATTFRRAVKRGQIADKKKPAEAGLWSGGGGAQTRLKAIPASLKNVLKDSRQRFARQPVLCGRVRRPFVYDRPEYVKAFLRGMGMTPLT